MKKISNEHFSFLLLKQRKRKHRKTMDWADCDVFTMSRRLWQDTCNCVKRKHSVNNESAACSWITQRETSKVFIERGLTIFLPHLSLSLSLPTLTHSIPIFCRGIRCNTPSYEVPVYGKMFFFIAFLNFFLWRC